MFRIFLVGLLLIHIPLSLQAQDIGLTITGESRQSNQVLAEVRQKIADKQSAEAIEILLNLIERGPDEIVLPKAEEGAKANPPVIQSLTTLRSQARLLLSQLPPDDQVLVRKRLDPQAARLLEQAMKGPDERLLIQLVSQAFCSQSAEKAIDLLGDLSFERGDYDSANYWWQLLLPVSEDLPANQLHYFKPQIPESRNRAKILLARLYRDGTLGTANDQASYRKQFPDASGKLAGREGKYADIFEEISQKQASANPDAFSWSTFGRNPRRNSLVPGANGANMLASACRQPFAIIELASHRGVLADQKTELMRSFGGLDLAPSPLSRTIQQLRLDRTLGFHPVFSDEMLFVANSRTVSGISLTSGTGGLLFDGMNSKKIANQPISPIAADLHHSLSLSGNSLLLARIGSSAIRQTSEEQPRQEKQESRLVCLDLSAKGGAVRERWNILPGQPGEKCDFEGTPLVDEGFAWIASTRQDNDHSTTRIHCYPVNSNRNPQPLWTKEIYQMRSGAGMEANRARMPVLSKAGPLVVYLSHQGALFALDAITGQKAWVVRYPSLQANDSNAMTNPIDIGPCLVDDNRLYVAPADSDLLFCVDRATGQLLWQRRKLNVSHLLGVCKPAKPSVPLLVITTAEGLLALDARTGEEDNGWRLPEAGGSLPPAGRGLLLGDLVIWPTLKGIYAISQSDGKPVSIPPLHDHVMPGNLAWSNGQLAVATKTHLFLYRPQTR